MLSSLASSLSLSSFEGFLLVAKEVFCLIRQRFPDARAKLDECLQEIRASGPRSLVEATSRLFDEEETIGGRATAFFGKIKNHLEISQA